VEIRKRRVQGLRSSRWRWHLDEMFVKINGRQHYLWRAVDHEGEVLESFVTKTRDKKAALKFLRKSMRRHGRPDELVTDRLRSYGAALKDVGRGDDRRMGRWTNNRAENSHLPFRRRERAMQRFRRLCHVDGGAREARLSRSSRSGGLAPARERLRPEFAKAATGDQVALDVEVVVDGGMGGKKPLRRAR
jgi:putative transposase